MSPESMWAFSRASSGSRRAARKAVPLERLRCSGLALLVREGRGWAPLDPERTYSWDYIQYRYHMTCVGLDDGPTVLRILMSLAALSPRASRGEAEGCRILSMSLRMLESRAQVIISYSEEELPMSFILRGRCDELPDALMERSDKWQTSYRALTRFHSAKYRFECSDDVEKEIDRLEVHRGVSLLAAGVVGGSAKHEASLEIEMHCERGVDADEGWRLKYEILGGGNVYEREHDARLYIL